MGVVMIPTYEVLCDDPDCTGVEALGVDSSLVRAQAFKDAAAAGWLRRGWKLYCPECREKHESKVSGKKARERK